MVKDKFSFWLGPLSAHRLEHEIEDMTGKVKTRAKKKIKEVVQTVEALKAEINETLHEKVNLLDMIKTSDLANKIAKRVLDTAEDLGSKIEKRTGFNPTRKFKASNGQNSAAQNSSGEAAATAGMKPRKKRVVKAASPEKKSKKKAAGARKKK